MNDNSSSKLIQAINKPINYEHYHKLRLIDGHDFTDVKKKVSWDLSLDSKDPYLEQGIEYLKRYYTLLLLNPGVTLAVSLPVDPFWHTHAIFTRRYMSFCQDVFGQYVHHNPLMVDDPIMMAQVKQIYDETYKIHAETFRDIDPALLSSNAADHMCCTM